MKCNQEDVKKIQKFYNVLLKSELRRDMTFLLKNEG